MERLMLRVVVQLETDV